MKFALRFGRFRFWSRWQAQDLWSTQPVTIRLDADVLEWFRSQGPGYQTRINRLLRRYMEVSQQRE